MRNAVRYLPLSLLVLLADQASKLWAYARLRSGSDHHVIDGFFKFSYAENPGIAFGIFAESNALLKTWVLVGVSLLAIGLVFYFLTQTPSGKVGVSMALAVLLGGIVGNLVDRVRLGVVIDFIEVYVGQYHWPTFNIADAAICLGAVLLSLDIVRDPSAKQRSNEG